jgi:hypothetical protein
MHMECLQMLFANKSTKGSNNNNDTLKQGKG